VINIILIGAAALATTALFGFFILVWLLEPRPPKSEPAAVSSSGPPCRPSLEPEVAARIKDD